MLKIYYRHKGEYFWFLVRRFHRFELCLRLLQRGKILYKDNHNNYYDPELKNRLKDRFINYTHELIYNKVAIENAFDNTSDQIINLAAQAGVRYSIEIPWHILIVILLDLHILESCKHRYI